MKNSWLVIILCLGVHKFIAMENNKNNNIEKMEKNEIVEKNENNEKNGKKQPLNLTKILKRKSWQMEQKIRLNFFGDPTAAYKLCLVDYWNLKQGNQNFLSEKKFEEIINKFLIIVLNKNAEEFIQRGAAYKVTELYYYYPEFNNPSVNKFCDTMWEYRPNIINLDEGEIKELLSSKNLQKSLSLKILSTQAQELLTTTTNTTTTNTNEKENSANSILKEMYCMLNKNLTISEQMALAINMRDLFSRYPNLKKSNKTIELFCEKILNPEKKSNQTECFIS